MIEMSQGPDNKRTLADIRGTVASDHLDLVRGLAALLVMVSHARVLFLESAGESVELGLIEKGLYILSGFGHQAVMVFFVLSGFFISSSVIRDVTGRTWSWRKYLTHRCTRLFVVLVPCLLLTVFWDSLGAYFLDASSPNDDTGIAIISADQISANSTVAAFVGNLLFLQTICVPSFGSNTALWSLSNEFWYYIIFPCVLLASSKYNTGMMRLCFAALSVAIFCFIGKPIAIYFLVWLLGALLSALPPLRQLASRRNIIVALVLAFTVFFAVLLAIGLRRIERGLFADFLVALSFGVCTYCLIHLRSPCRTGVYPKVARKIAGFSFSLYALHLPPLIFLRACFTSRVAWSPDVNHWCALGAIITLVMIYAWAISYLTERHTSSIRNWIVSRYSLHAYNLSAQTRGATQLKCD